jgi:DNA-directed RNA polymerase specialized sigma24 family protein
LHEIASITDISVNAVTVNLSRARQKIRVQLINENKEVEEKVWRT